MCAISCLDDPPAKVEPFQVMLKPDVNVSKVNARPRVCLTENTAYGWTSSLRNWPRLE